MSGLAGVALLVEPAAAQEPSTPSDDAPPPAEAAPQPPEGSDTPPEVTPFPEPVPSREAPPASAGEPAPLPAMIDLTRPTFASALQEGRFGSSFGLYATLGLAFGGEKLATLEYTDGSSNAVRGGEGINLSAGFTFTPLWIGDVVGFGVGADIGWKYKTTSAEADGSVAIRRFPLVTSLRGLVNLGKSWHLLAAGGLVVELGPTLYGSGALEGYEAEFDTGIGGMGELGVLWGRPKSVGYSITGRYTTMEYRYAPADETVDASSGSVHLSAHYFF